MFLTVFEVELPFYNKLKKKRQLVIESQNNIEDLILNMQKNNEIPKEKVKEIILILDVRNSTQLLKTSGEYAFVTMLENFQTILTKTLKLSKGNLIKIMGDEVIIFFSYSEDLFDFLKKFNEFLYRYNSNLTEKYLSINISAAATIGELIKTTTNEFLGSALNLCVRLIANAKTNEILISEELYDNLSDFLKNNFNIQKNKTELKGFGTIVFYSLNYKNVR